MADFQQGANEIQELISNYISKMGSQNFNNTFQNLILELNNYYQQSKNLEIRLRKRYLNNIENSININNQDYIQEGNHIAESKNDKEAKNYIRYQAAKNALIEESSFTNIVLKGYEIVNKISQFFTGNFLQYQIGVVKYGKLYEGTIEFEQLKEIAKAEASWKNSANNVAKIRLVVSKSSLIDKYHLQLADENEVSSSSLYSKVHKIALGAGGKYNFITKNEGNIYEAYRLLMSRGYKNRPPKVPVKTIQQALKEVIKNTASWVKGGDVGNYQVKFFGNSSPSLTGLVTINDSIENLLKILTRTIIEEKEIEEIFLKKEEQNKNKDKIKNILKSITKEDVDDLVKELKNIKI